MMALRADETGINQWILIGIIVLIVLVSIAFLVGSLKFRIKLWSGGYEEKLNHAKDNPNDD